MMNWFIKIIAVLTLINYWQTELLADTTEIENTMLMQKENDSKDWLNKPQGFLWYNEKQMQESPSHSKSKLSSEVKQEPHDQRIEALKQQFNRSQRIALDNPTLENVIKAQRLQKIIMEKSQKFAAMWQLATLIDPSLTNANEPVNSLHKRLYQELLEQNNGQKLQSWGLILQVNNKCPYCHAFVPIVHQFANKYGFQLLLVSNSGANFQNIKTTADTGLLQALNPENVVPVLYLVSDNGKRIYPIARSLVSDDKIIENIIAIDLHYQNLAKSKNNGKKY
ncbi:conjugal transfer protein TraF [Candidatus Tisiphia endosymbiont of Dascillus cervinus]|uniref:conjugal transfer protein TraF n=1 Tax=Candidatus Tisiphia endosymbiont of Dascillus cervinus TaxID=3066253 RepID=UPI003977D978